jgi:CHAT domain-containing protein
LRVVRVAAPSGLAGPLGRQQRVVRASHRLLPRLAGTAAGDTDARRQLDVAAVESRRRRSQAVVATTRPVTDRAAAAIVDAFYRRWSGGQPPAAALQQAQLALRGADTNADWSAFRLLSR